MKKTVRKGRPSVVKYFCENHPKKECFTEIKTTSWYGSCYDLTGLEFHLCDDCFRIFLDDCLASYEVKPKDYVL